MFFRDRSDAGRKLAIALATYRGENVVIYALPRGGVAVGAEVARVLDAPLDLVLVRKVGTPGQPELAMGAVVDGGEPLVIRNEDVLAMAGISATDFDLACQRELAEIERRRKLYLAGRKPIDPAGRIAIVIDDGIATGATVKAALRALRRRMPAKLILAVPVAPPDAIAGLLAEADAVECLDTPEPFGAIGYFYDDFHQLSDADVIDTLAQFAPHSS
jgi:predicted phosphoribosyltransferase